MFAVYAKQLAGYNSYYINLYRSGTGEPVASEQLSAGISALTIDNNGSVWYSTENGMFYRGLLENGKLNTSRIKTSTNNQNIAMAELDDGVYAVSNNGVFTRYSDGKETGFADSLNLKVSTACYEKDTNRFVLLTDSDVRSVNCETGKIQTVMKLSGQTSGVIYGNRLVVRNSAQLFSYDVEQASSSAVLKAVYYVSLVASVCFGILLIIFVISLFDNFSRKIIKYLKSIAAELNKSKRYYLYLLPTFTLLGIFYFLSRNLGLYAVLSGLSAGCARGVCWSAELYRCFTKCTVLVRCGQYGDIFGDRYSQGADTSDFDCRGIDCDEAQAGSVVVQTADVSARDSARIGRTFYLVIRIFRQ